MQAIIGKPFGMADKFDSRVYHVWFLFSKEQNLHALTGHVDMLSYCSTCSFIYAKHINMRTQLLIYNPSHIERAHLTYLSFTACQLQYTAF